MYQPCLASENWELNYAILLNDKIYCVNILWTLIHYIICYGVAENTEWTPQGYVLTWVTSPSPWFLAVFHTPSQATVTCYYFCDKQHIVIASLQKELLVCRHFGTWEGRREENKRAKQKSLLGYTCEKDLPRLATWKQFLLATGGLSIYKYALLFLHTLQLSAFCKQNRRSGRFNTGSSITLPLLGMYPC